MFDGEWFILTEICNGGLDDGRCNQRFLDKNQKEYQ
jgi:hypothetical protein